jgi:hypothetical protein
MAVLVLEPPKTVTAVDMWQMCEACGFVFGRSQAEKCLKCNALVCPSCGVCNCEC